MRKWAGGKGSGWGSRRRAGVPNRCSHFPTFPPAHFPGLIIAGPAPAPLLRAETFYRYQLMLRTRAMSRLSLALAQITTALALPEDVALTVDIDPVDLV